MKPATKNDEFKSEAIFITEKQEIAEEKEFYTNQQELSNEHITYVHQPSSIKSSLPYLNKIDIIGPNFKPEIFETLEDVHLDYKTSRKFSPIQYFYKRKLKKNEKFNFTIKTEFNQHNIVKIKIKHIQDEVEKKISSADTLIEISLNENLSSGYHLSEVILYNDSDSIIDKIQCPFYVGDSNLSDILFLSGLPNFEHSTLKNWLIEQGHGLSYRSEISPGKFRFTFHNGVPELKTEVFDSKYLKLFDLVIIDGKTLAGLSQSDLQVLNKITKYNTSILLLYDNSFSNLNKLLSGFGEITNSNSISFNFKNESLGTWGKRMQFKSAAKETDGYSFRYNNQPGRAFVSFNNSYTLKLSGKGKIYHSLWAEIINGSLGVERNANLSWRMDDAPYFDGHEVKVNYISKEIQPIVLVVSPSGKKIVAKVEQHIQLENQFQVRFFAAEKGWYSIYEDQNPLNKTKVFVQDKSSSFLKQSYEHEINIERYIKAHNKRASIIQANKQHDVFIPINALWFVLGFVFFVSLLWFVEKR